MTNPFAMLLTAAKRLADALNRLAEQAEGISAQVEARTEPLQALEHDQETNGTGRRKVAAK